MKTVQRLTVQALLEAGIIKKTDGLVKMLANGEITSSVTLDVDKGKSPAARAKVDAAGGIRKGVINERTCQRGKYS